MTTANFDWTGLAREFEEAVTVPGLMPGQDGSRTDRWWAGWHAHLAKRTSPRCFYSTEDAPDYFTDWSLTLSL